MADYDVRMPAASTSRLGGRLGNLVYDTLKARVLDGVYPAGERISLEELKREFEVSKQPVMEAMRQLAAAGLIEILPQVGCRVPRYSPAEVRDFFVLFGSVEGAIAGIAASRWRGAELDEIEDLNRRIAQLDASVSDAATRSRQYLTLNRQLHRAIQTISGSRVIADMSQRMFDLSDLLINTAGVPHPLAAAIGERAHDHDEIIAALRVRDSKAAQAAMERHILATVDLIHARSSRTGTEG
jgi:DNA-binding GntR family transcriptional regulator